MVSIRSIIIFIVLFAPISVFGQPVLSGAPALQLAERSTEALLTPDITVNPAGEALILWEDTSLWVNGMGTPISREAAPSNLCRVFSLQESSWTGVYMHSSRITSGLEQGFTDTYFCGAGSGSGFSDTSGGAAEAYRIMYMGGGGDGRWASVLPMTGMMLNDALMLTTMERGGSIWTGIMTAFDRVQLLRWKPGGDVEVLFRQQRDLRYNPRPDSLHGMLRVSVSADTGLVLYRRASARASFNTPGQLYERSMCRIDLPTGTVRDTVVLDTVPAVTLDLSDAILPPRQGSLDILRRDLDNDQLFVERFALDGSRMDSIPLIGPLRVDHVLKPYLSPAEAMEEPWFTRGDFDQISLADGKHLIAWSEPRPEGAVILVAMFDQDWNLLGAVKQAHPNGDALRVYPRLAARDNRLYLVWHERQTGHSTLWLKMFTPDNLTAVDVTPCIADALTVSSWPQPVNDRLHLRVNGPAPRNTVDAELVILDLLGRVRHSQRVHTASGMADLTVDVSTWPPGWYGVLLRSGEHYSTSRVLVQHKVSIRQPR